MNLTTTLRRIAALLVLAVLPAACFDGGGDARSLVSLAISPTTPSIAQGLSQQFTATGTFSDGGTQDLSGSVQWASSNTGVATVNVSGLAAGISTGTATVTAQSGAVSGSTLLTVLPPALQSLAVTPANAALELGANQAFAATGTLTDGSHADLTQSVSWSSSDVAVVRVNTSTGRVGVANTRGPGAANITAAIGSVSAQAAVTVTRRTPKYLYAANLGASTVSAFRVDPATGALSAIGTPAATTSGSTSIATSRDFKFLYSADFGLGNVSGFVIQPDGTLSAAAATPLVVGNGPLSLVAHPTADFLYVAQQGSGITILAINPGSGALVVAGVVSRPYAPEFGAMSPDGQYYYQTLSSIDQIEPFAADGATGALTPLSAGPAATEVFPRAIAIDPAGKFLYAAISDSGTGTSTTVDGFLIDASTGALTKMPASPFQVATTPDSIAIDASGRFLYVSCINSSIIGAFAIDPDTGTLSAVPGSPFAAPGLPLFVLVDPSGQFLYAGTDSATAGVLGYTIDQTTGALTPNAAGSAPGNIVWSLAATR